MPRQKHRAERADCSSILAHRLTIAQSYTKQARNSLPGQQSSEEPRRMIPRSNYKSVEKANPSIETCPCRSGTLSSKYMCRTTMIHILIWKITPKEKKKNRADHIKKAKSGSPDSVPMIIQQQERQVKRGIKFWSTDEHLTSYRRTLGQSATTRRFDWSSVFCMSTILC